ncbi:MAG: flagellar basal body protein, partial [Solirubrobacteraceae bacterium]
MSIGSILNMAREGLRAQQQAINTASQNIANAQTAGYSRQRVELRASLPTVFPYGSVGTGVDIASITRARDSLLDMAYRTDSAASTGADTRASSLEQMQNI